MTEKILKIKSIGIELEGGMDYEEFDKLLRIYKRDNRFGYGEDGSVNVEGKELYNLELKYYSEDIEELFKFIETVFSLGFEQNNTCGNHLHLVFNNQELAVALLSFKETQERFFKAYKEKYKNNSKYIARCSNSYCKMVYDRYAVLNQLYYDYKTDRYYTINLNSYNIHGTIEIRILPYFEDAKEARDAITWLINTIEEILNAVLQEQQQILDYENISIKLPELTEHETIEIKVFEI